MEQHPILEQKTLSQEERDRTKRQKLLDGWDQQALKNSTVFIAGVGALGCEIAKDFALMGIGKLMLCDLDKIETSNLSRQMLFYRGDEGRYKAEVAAERLKLMNPFMETEVFTFPLQQIPMDKYLECEVVIAALDNVKARMDLNKFCLKLGIPLIEGGTVGFEGHIQVILPETTTNEAGEPIDFGNENQIIEDITAEMLWGLDEGENPAYFQAQKEIEALEKQIEALKQEFIIPVEEKIRLEAREKIASHPEKYLNFTPCYRCAVPIPPPPQQQVAACTLKGVPRTREHCAIRGEVLFIKQFDRKPDYDNNSDMAECLKFAQKELYLLRERVLDESIPPEAKYSISKQEKDELMHNIFETFGGDFHIDDMENILGNKIPAIQSVSSIISSIQSQEALKLIFLRKGKKVGPIMDPPYLNYNGIYGQFDQVPLGRREDCVACGSGKGSDNLTVVIPETGTIGDVFIAVSELTSLINLENWMITNPLTKQFIYNPLFEKGKTQNQLLRDAGIKHMDELTFTAFGKLKDSLEVKQYNVIVQML